MFKSIEVSCPARIVLPINKFGKIEYINQFINLYDNLVIKENKDNLMTLSSNSNSINLNNNICTLICNLFFEYTKINYRFFSIYIEKNIPINKGLSGSIISAIGLLNGLNTYYHTNLNNKDFINIFSMIGIDVSSYLSNELSKNRLINNSNPYNSYLLIEPNTEFTSNDLSKLESLKDDINLYTNSKYLISSIGLIKLIAIQDKYIKNGLYLKLKKEFPNYKIYSCKNEIGYKTLIKYPERLDI